MQTHGTINTLKDTNKTYVNSLKDFNDVQIDMSMIEDDV
jgi:hypothetical protein